MQTTTDPDFKEPLFKVIKGCVKGDRKCQQILYEKFYGKMLGICMRYSKNIEEAHDILQDGFIKVFTNIKRYGNEGSFEGWVHKIIINTAIDSIRKNKDLLRHTSTDNLKDTSDEIEDADNEFANITHAQIIEAVQQLTPVYRTVFNMYVIEEFSHKEIAQQLGISEGTSKSDFAKAKRNLKKILTGKKKFKI